MRLQILGFVVLSAFLQLTLVAASGAAPPQPDRNPRIAMAEKSGAAPPLPERNSLRPSAPVPAKPEEAKPVLPGDQPTVAWSDTEIEAAPVLLRAVGTDPRVTINPPATLSCPMADVLGEWLRDTVQPEAKKLFGSTVVKIQNASSYVCRNRYGGANTPLSEHALANAFDESEFVLANGTRITILNDWPKALEPPSAPGDSSSSATLAGNEAPKSKPTDKTTGVVTVTDAKAEPSAPPAPPTGAAAPEQDPKAQFVLYLHEDACRRFGTVLGPEANAAHKNHFHLDMKTRKKSFCE